MLPLAGLCACSIHGASHFSAAPAASETAQPVRPGIPGERPFWNTHSAWGFMYAPAFDLKEVEGATSYRFTLTPQAGGAELSFTAEKPWAALSPVWDRVPVGFIRLAVDGLANGKLVGISGTRDFYRKSVFEGKGPQAVRPYGECGELKLKHLYEASYVRHWLDHDVPDPAYSYYCYPSKMIGSILVGLARYSRLNPAARETALIMASHAADFLIRHSAPPDAAYAYFPPTYMGEHAAAKGKNDIVMMNYPEEVSQGYLDLYDATREERYFKAAENIAKTYLKTQLPDGTWPLSVKPLTGQVVSANSLIPIGVIRLLHRLDKQYGRTEFRPAAKTALSWIIANPIKTFNWEGQFEDVVPSAPYKNLSKGQACDIAAYMLDNADEDPRYEAWAMDIIRFAEDQFVVWDRPNPDLKPVNWLTPCALEQYVWMMPINDSASDLMLAWAAAYRRTGRDIFRQKARALANAMTVSQLKDGELPTYWHHTDDCWMNCAVYAAVSMLKLEEAGIRAVLPEKI